MDTKSIPCTDVPSWKLWSLTSKDLRPASADTFLADDPKRAAHDREL